MRRPDLFIVGAPKCGTTALYRYLAEHPRILMSRRKEPGYFAPDYHRFVTDIDEYVGLFGAATDRHLAVGEASTSYLGSSVALPLIREFSPDARIVAMVRSPVDMVHSLHGQQLLTLNEDEQDFERAWRMQEARSRGEAIPRHCRSPKRLQYAAVGRLGEQVERLFEIFDRRRVKVIVFDDFVADTRRAYEDVLAFLDVPSDGRIEFPRVNPGQSLRSSSLARWTRRTPRVLLEAYLRVKALLGFGDLGVTRWLNSVNAKVAPRVPLSSAFRRELVETFRPDVGRLGRLLGRDLSHWLDVADDEPRCRDHA